MEASSSLENPWPSRGDVSYHLVDNARKVLARTSHFFKYDEISAVTSYQIWVLAAYRFSACIFKIQKVIEAFVCEL